MPPPIATFIKETHMNRLLRPLTSTVVFGLLALCATSCGRRQDLHARPSALPQPVGAFVSSTTQQMAIRAEADDFVLYDRFWNPGAATLPPHGRDRLDSIIARLAHEPYPIVIESTNDAKLDERRRATVAALVASAVDPAIKPTVIVARPEAEGMTAADGMKAVHGR